MTAPLLSLCVPTYNRARYLDSLLDTLALQLRDFPYPFEIVISDNGSTDATPDVVARHAARLPIRGLRHAQTLGCYPNVTFALGQARGRYLMYLADDDCVLGAPLADAVAALEADPDCVIAYAPWLLYDLVAQRAHGTFYTQPQDLHVERGDHAALLDHVLRHQVFPEIWIARSDAWRRLMPRVGEIAFFAFAQAADWLQQGAVALRREPFYVSMTRYFADEQRTQVGFGEVEVAWDRYRGGLEVLLAHAADRLTPEERTGYQLRIQHMVAQRMAVAVRLRHANGRDPVDTHTLALRLKGMGYGHLLPVPLDTLAARATLHFLLEDEALNRDRERLVCVGPFDDDARAYLRARSRRAVQFVDDAAELPALRDAVLFVSERAHAAAPDAERALAHNLAVVREADLCGRFGLAA